MSVQGALLSNKFIVKPNQKDQTGKNERNGGYDSAEHDEPR